MGRSLISERMEIYAYYGIMIAIYKLLPPEEREDLERWDSEMVTGDGTFATSDWPGWEKYIGKMPKYPLAQERNKEPIPNEIRWAVWERDNFTCQKCGTRKFLSVDHIIPESKGGTLEMNNLQALCCTCNSRKGAKMPRGTET